MPMRTQVLGGFKRLLRARTKVFSGDENAMEASRKQLRAEFLKQRNETDVKKIEKHLVGIKEVEEMLLFNVVQGKSNERGNYEVKIEPQHTTDHQHMAPARVIEEQFDKNQKNGVIVDKTDCCQGDTCSNNVLLASKNVYT